VEKPFWGAPKRRKYGKWRSLEREAVKENGKFENLGLLAGAKCPLFPPFLERK